MSRYRLECAVWSCARCWAVAALALSGTVSAGPLVVSGGVATVGVFATHHNRDSNGDGIDDWAAVYLGLSRISDDSTGDGIPDWWLLRHGLDPLDPLIGEQDLSGGGLTVREEYGYGTSPWKVDTTGNGWWDSFEVAWGADPADPANSPHSPVYADVNADGRVNAADVQLVVNAVLGNPVPVPVKIDGSGPVSAKDVQQVINAALGFSR